MDTLGTLSPGCKGNKARLSKACSRITKILNLNQKV